MTCVRQLWIVGGAVAVAIGVAGALALGVWLVSPDPIAQLGGRVRTERLPPSGINTLIGSILPGFNPGGREVVVEVWLYDTDASNATLECLRGMEKLRRLDLRRTRVDDDGLALIAEFPQLERLHLDQTAVTDAGVAHLATHPALQILDLNGTVVGDAGLKQIARIPSLWCLDLNQTAVTDAGVAHLATHRGLKGLKLNGTAVGDAGLKQIARIDNLIGLFLRETDISDEGLESLQRLSGLKKLVLGHNPRVTHAGIRRLVDAVPALTVESHDHDPERRFMISRRFDVANRDQPAGVVWCVTWHDATDAELARLAAYPGLTELYLWGSPITDAGLQHLQQLPQLRQLCVLNTHVTERGVRALLRVRPGMSVLR